MTMTYVRSSAVTSYVALGVVKFVEEDDYKHGCLPDTGYMVDMKGLDFESGTLEGVKESVANYFGVYVEDLSHDGDSLRAQVMETADGYTASDSDIVEWKDGGRTLYLAEYVFRLVKQTPVLG